MMKPQGLSKADMRAEIRRLNRINSDIAEYKTIKQIYERMVNGIMVVVGTTLSHELYFRARVNPTKKIVRVSEIGAPPASMVTGFQRCNAPGNPLFYCSSRRITALMECRVQPGDVVYLGQWIGRDALPVNKVLDPNDDPLFVKALTETENMFYTHLDTIFTRRVHETFSNDYKFSSAASEEMTLRFPVGKFNIENDGCIGMRYPSVFDLEGSHNTAFPVQFSLNRLDFIHLMELRVESTEGDRIEVTLLDTAINFENGDIRWTGNLSSLPIPKRDKDGVMFRRSEKGWDVYTADYLNLPPEAMVPLLKELIDE